MFDYHLATGDKGARQFFDACVETLRSHLESYDIGYWSLYEHSGTRLPMVASPFYHRLHIVQLRVTAKMAEERSFSDMADRWQTYLDKPFNRRRALLAKAVFKVAHY